MKTKDGTEIIHRDMGEWPLQDPHGKKYQGYMSCYRIGKKEYYTTVEKALADKNIAYRIAEELNILRAKGIKIDEASI